MKDASALREVPLKPTTENLLALSEPLHPMGDTEKSLRVSEKVIYADSGCFKGYVHRAQLLGSVGHFPLAVSEYDKALFLAPKGGCVYYERGIVQMHIYLHWRPAFQLNFVRGAAQPHGADVSADQRLHELATRSPFEPPLVALGVELALGADG